MSCSKDYFYDQSLHFGLKHCSMGLQTETLLSLWDHKKQKRFICRRIVTWPEKSHAGEWRQDVRRQSDCGFILNISSGRRLRQQWKDSALDGQLFCRKTLTDLIVGCYIGTADGYESLREREDIWTEGYKVLLEVLLLHLHSLFFHGPRRWSSVSFKHRMQVQPPHTLIHSDSCYIMQRVHFDY